MSASASAHSWLIWPFAHALTRSSAEMNPSILPPFTSCSLAQLLCGPPTSYSPVSWYGFQHFPLSSGTHTSNEPSGLRGMPSAPGNVPK